MDTSVAQARLRASRMLRRLAAACGGGEVFLTGGSLRDRFLGVATHDFDLVVRDDVVGTSAALAKALGGSRFILGRPPLATHRVVAGTVQVDLWQADGAMRDDVLRRDFTVNALLWRLPRGPLIDLVGGADDLAAGRIRVVRAANLADDPLRVLRGVRLLATRPQLKLTAQTEALLAAAASGLTQVARERIVDEVRRLLAGPAAERATLTTLRLGLLVPLIPSCTGAEPGARLGKVAGALSRMSGSGSRRLAGGAAEVAPVVFAALAGGWPDAWSQGDVSAALQRLGIGAGAARRIAAAAGYGERLRHALGRDRAAGREIAVEAASLCPAAAAWAAAREAADGRDRNSEARALLAWLHRFEQRPPLLSGAEIAAVLRLPADRRRAEAAGALRRAQALGQARNRAQALAFLRRRRR
jgi:poly(A) polymerase